MRTSNARTRNEGFTLIELLVVVIIVGILAGVAVPTFLGQRGKANTAAVKTDLKSGALAMEDAFVETSAYPASLPPGFKLSDGVTIRRGEMSVNDFNYVALLAACNTYGASRPVPYKCTHGVGSNINGTYLHNGAEAMKATFAQFTTFAATWSYTGSLPVGNPSAAVDAPFDGESYCLQGSHVSSPSDVWSWKPSSGGLQKGPC